MKIKVWGVALLMLLSITVKAQDWSTDVYKYGESYEGYVIEKSGKKIEGFIKYRNRVAMQDDIIFYKVKDNPSTKTKYMPEDLKEFKVGDKLYHCINYSGGASLGKIKANLLRIDGCIKTYTWYERADSYNSLQKREGESDEDFGNRMFPSSTAYFKDGDEMAVNDAYFEANFEKNMASYLSDNKELSKKVKSGASGYQFFNIADIFAEYNKNCGM